MKKLTIFTPTYNRANKLFRLYCSLCAQRDKDFEWLIVDDGSMDNTEDIVREWISENIITIYYYKQQNEGKMRAHNYGVSLTNTSYFVCVDSDDYLIDSAVEIICKSMNDIPSGISIGGIIFLKTLQGQDIQQAQVPVPL